MKFAAYEANAMQDLVASSLLRSWTYGVFGVQALSSLIGITLLAIAGLIATRPFSAWVAVLSSALAVGMFLTTLSFVLSTPGVWEASLGGFPAVSVLPGQFLLKDIVLLGAAMWSFGEAWKHRRR
jgi:reactive chlorine resistance protein C